MKSTVIVLLAFTYLKGLSQTAYPLFTFNQSQFVSRVREIDEDVLDKSLRLASYFINSKEFKDSMLQLSFPYENVCTTCVGGKKDLAKSVTGLEILTKIFSSPSPTLTFELKKRGKPPIFGKCWSLGYTCPFKNHIESYYKNINCSMGDSLPFEFSYAVHICHEYMHNIGYCHTDNKVENDIAEAVGEIAFYYIKNWNDSGKLK